VLGPAVKPGNQPEAAGIVFKIRVVECFQRPYSCVWTVV
jgi:hypothetical protein